MDILIAVDKTDLFFHKVLFIAGPSGLTNLFRFACVATFWKMDHSGQKNKTGLNDIPEPIEFQKYQVKGEYYEGRWKEQVKSSSSPERLKYQPCRAKTK